MSSGSGGGGGMSKSSRKYDVVVYGASGYTGGLVVDWLSRNNGRKAMSSDTTLSWALAGRDAKKLQAVIDGLGELPANVHQPDIIVCDSYDQQSLQKMTSQTRAVITTVGPYAKYGEPLVAACVRTGTDCCDLTGEILWAKQMINQYQDAAVKNQSLIVHSCGFDSVPSDLGCFLAVRYLQSHFQTQPVHVQGYVRLKGVKPSGGTIASLMLMMEQPKEELKKARDLFYLTSDRTRAAWNGDDGIVRRSLDQWLPRWDNTIQKWTVPFVMATYNTRIVRRTGGLVAEDNDNESFGPEFTYNECMEVDSIPSAFIAWLGIVLTILVVAITPLRNLAKKFLPAPGQGPSKSDREQARWQIRVIGFGKNGKKSLVSMKGTDPGYHDTAIMLAEMGLLLAFQREEIKAKGGFPTPAYVGQFAYANRLKGTGHMTITEGEFK